MKRVGHRDTEKALRAGRRSLMALAAALSLATTTAQAQGAAGTRVDFETVRAAAAQAVSWGNFDELERQFKRMREQERRTAAGTLESTAFQMGLGHGAKPGPGLRVQQAGQTAALTAKWVQQHPASPLAHVLHVDALVAQGWAYRGTGYANTVAPQAWAHVQRALEQATAHAAAHAEVLLSDSLGFQSLLGVARAVGWDVQRTQAIYELAVQRFPRDDALHEVQLMNVLPKWGGNPRLVNQHIEAVVQRTQASHGQAFYAVLYKLAAEQQFEQALFTDSMARWERMDKGFADLTARYPHAAHYNAWAWMGCQAQDRARVLELLDKLAPEPDLRQWGSNARATYDTCKAWAQKL